MKREPTPTSLTHSIVPPCARTIACAMAKPNPPLCESPPKDGAAVRPGHQAAIYKPPPRASRAVRHAAYVEKFVTLIKLFELDFAHCSSKYIRGLRADEFAPLQESIESLQGALARLVLPRTADPIQEEMEDHATATLEQRWQWSAMNHLSDIVVMFAYWDREFGKDWQKFERPSALVTLAKEADAAFSQLLKTLI